jgi:hypothetical protein
VSFASKQTGTWFRVKKGKHTPNYNKIISRLCCSYIHRGQHPKEQQYHQECRVAPEAASSIEHAIAVGGWFVVLCKKLTNHPSRSKKTICTSIVIRCRAECYYTTSESIRWIEEMRDATTLKVEIDCRLACDRSFLVKIKVIINQD